MGKPKKMEKHSVSKQYAEICDTTHSWFPKGLGEYAMKRMEQAVESKDGPLTVKKFEGSAGDRVLHGTYILFDGVKLGFATVALKHFERVAVPYSKFATAYAKVLHDFKKSLKSATDKAGKSTGMTRVAYKAAAMKADCETKHSDCMNDLGRSILEKRKAKAKKKTAKNSVKKLKKAAKKAAKAVKKAAKKGVKKADVNKAVAKKAAAKKAVAKKVAAKKAVEKKVIKKVAKKTVKKLIKAEAKKQAAAKANATVAPKAKAKAVPTAH